MSSVLFIGPYGIGNLLMAMPAIHGVAETPGWTVAIGCLLPSTEAICREIQPFRAWFDRVYALHKAHGYRALVSELWSARRRKFDYSVVMFPSARIHYNVMSLLPGARTRVGSIYAEQPLAQGAWLNHVRVPVSEQLHDVAQMIALVRAGLGIDIPSATDYVFRSPPKNPDLVAIHPGCKKADEHKRWELDNYLETIGRLARRHQRLQFRVYFGPDEIDDMGRFQALIARPSRAHLSDRIEVRTGLSIPELFDDIGECQYFVGNDSGLMHIAAAQDCIVAGIIGPSDERRTGPFGRNSTVISYPMECRPCTHTNKAREFEFRCVHSERLCLAGISPDALVEWFEENRPMR